METSNKKIIWAVLILIVFGAGAWFLTRDDTEMENKQLLEPTQQERVSVEEGSDFSFTQGQERWVEDLRITFSGVEDDSRCPADVVCVQAGWVTLRFRAGDEEILLRLPGDSIVPNAAVVGSYIITLVNVEPVAKSNESQESRAYSATLRVEAHDNKG